jgi:hypothetical protein
MSLAYISDFCDGQEHDEILAKLPCKRQNAKIAKMISNKFVRNPNFFPCFIFLNPLATKQIENQ